jgi:hypothetical protein
LLESSCATSSPAAEIHAAPPPPLQRRYVAVTCLKSLSKAHRDFRLTGERPEHKAGPDIALNSKVRFGAGSFLKINNLNIGARRQHLSLIACTHGQHAWAGTLKNRARKMAAGSPKFGKIGFCHGIQISDPLYQIHLVVRVGTKGFQRIEQSSATSRDHRYLSRM